MSRDRNKSKSKKDYDYDYDYDYDADKFVKEWFSDEKMTDEEREKEIEKLKKQAEEQSRNWDLSRNFERKERKVKIREGRREFLAEACKNEDAHFYFHYEALMDILNAIGDCYITYSEDNLTEAELCLQLLFYFNALHISTEENIDMELDQAEYLLEQGINDWNVQKSLIGQMNDLFYEDEEPGLIDGLEGLAANSEALEAYLTKNPHQFDKYLLKFYDMVAILQEKYGVCMNDEMELDCSIDYDLEKAKSVVTHLHNVMDIRAMHKRGELSQKDFIHLFSFAFASVYFTASDEKALPEINTTAN